MNSVHEDNQREPQSTQFYQFMRIAVTITALVLLPTACAIAWEQRSICTHYSTKTAASQNADRQKEESIVGPAAPVGKTAQSCSQSDEDGKAISSAIGSAILIVVLYLLTMIILSVINKASLALSSKLAVDTKRSKDRYSQLESLILWRFSKVLFWTILPIIIAYMLMHKSYDDEYPLQGIGIGLAILSLPLYLIFKRAALYIASGKKDNSA